MAKYGDGSNYNDGSNYGEVPRDYPYVSTYIGAWLIGSAPIALQIVDDAKVSGIVPLRIEDVLGQKIKRCYCTHRSSTGQDANMEGHKEVLIKDSHQNHLFYGIIETFDEWADGIEFYYNLMCVNWAWFLGRPGSTETDSEDDDALVNEIYENQTDAYIIDAVLSKYCKIGDIAQGSEQPIFDTTTHVATIETLPLERYENLTPEQVLDRICRRTGGVYYVDDGPAGACKANLHYFAPGAETAPYELMDDPVSWDYITYFPCRKLHRHRGATVANRVKVLGRRYVSPTSGYTTIYFDGTGSKTQFELANKLIAGEDRSTILVYVYEDLNGGADWYPRKTGGKSDSFADFDVLHYFDRKELRFAVAPPAGTDNIKIECREIIERTHTAQDQASFDDIGRWIAITVRDTRVTDDATCQLVAEKELAVRLHPTTYRCATNEPGLRAGQTLKVTNAARGLSAEELVVQKVSSRMVADGFWRYGLELGTYFPTVVDVIRNIAQGFLAENELGDKGHARGQIMFAVPGTLTLGDLAPWYVCGIPDGLQIVGTQLIVKTAPAGANIIIKLYKWLDADQGWWSMYTAGNEPYIADGEAIGVDGTLSSMAGLPLLEKGQMIKMIVDQAGSATPGAWLTVSVMVRQ